MTSKTFMLYKGPKSTELTESACITFSADRVDVSKDETEFIFYNKDGSVGATLTIHNGAKLREIGT